MILRDFENSGISTPSIYTSRPSRDPNLSFNSQHRCQNPRSGLSLRYRVAIVSLSLPLNEQDEIRKAFLTKQENERIE